MRLGIYGGAFSPVHNAHVEIARAFALQYDLDKLLIIPAGIAPHKHLEYDASAHQRLEMCRKAFEGIPNAEVSDIEICREGKSYTAVTVRELSKLTDELYMLVGSDKIPTLEKWYCADEIFDKCTIVCAYRKGESANTEGKISEYKVKYGAKIEILEIIPDDISSEKIRKLISEGKIVSEFIPPEVDQYIKENGLYLNKNEQ